MYLMYNYIINNNYQQQKPSEKCSVSKILVDNLGVHWPCSMATSSSRSKAAFEIFTDYIIKDKKSTQNSLISQHRPFVLPNRSCTSILSRL